MSATKPTTTKRIALLQEWLLFFGISFIFVLLLLLLMPGICDNRDYGRMHSFYKFFYREQINQGQLPLWNPYIGLGRPFLGDIETATLYPFNLFFAVVPEGFDFVLATAFHFAFAAFFCRRLAHFFEIKRGWDVVVALAFLLSGQVTGLLQIGAIQYVYSICYWPLSLWLVCRLQQRPQLRLWLMLSGVLALQFLCGHPHFFWLNAVGLTIFIIGYRWQSPVGKNLLTALRECLQLALAYIFAFAIAGAQTLPFYQLVTQSNRTTSSLDFSASFAMPWHSLRSLFIPNNPILASSWQYYLYCGVLFAIAGICGLSYLRHPRMRALAWLALVSLLIAPGRQTPCFVLFYYIIPGFGNFRIPARFIFFISFSLLMSGGYWLSSEHNHDNAIRRLSVVTLIALATIGYWFVPECRRRPQAIGYCLATLSMVIVSVYFLYQLSSRPKATIKVMATIGVLIAAEMMWAAWNSGQIYQEQRRTHEKKLAQIIKRRYPDKFFPVRISFPRSIILENSGMRYKYSNFSCYCALNLQRVWKYLHQSLDVPVPTLFNTYPCDAIYHHGPFPYHTMNLRIGYHPRQKIFCINPHPDPRVYLVFQAQTISDLQQAITKMRQGHDVHQCALIEKPWATAANWHALANATNGVGAIEILEFANETIRLRTQNSRPAILVLAESWYPGWSACINGKTTACFPVNAWMRGVVVPEGSHEVVLSYSSSLLKYGVACSLTAIMIWIGLWFGSRLCLRIAFV